MTIKAMKQALEALEYAMEYNRCNDLLERIKQTEPKAKTAITSLRQAIANEALDKKAENARELGLDYEPVQAEKQKPVANAKAIAECLAVLRPAVKGKWPHEQALEELARYTTPQPQEFVCSTGLCHYKQREWVGLTDEEIYACDETSGLPQHEITNADLQAFASAIEAKLKEKNT